MQDDGSVIRCMREQMSNHTSLELIPPTCVRHNLVKSFLCIIHLWLFVIPRVGVSYITKISQITCIQSSTKFIHLFERRWEVTSFFSRANDSIKVSYATPRVVKKGAEMIKEGPRFVFLACFRSPIKTSQHPCKSIILHHPRKNMVFRKIYNIQLYFCLPNKSQATSPIWLLYYELVRKR